jgi:hypothetical protein
MLVQSDISHKLRVAEVELSKWNDMGQIYQKLGITNRSDIGGVNNMEE